MAGSDGRGMLRELETRQVPSWVFAITGHRSAETMDVGQEDDGVPSFAYGLLSRLQP
jgi:hypothetical protein